MTYSRPRAGSDNTGVQYPGAPEKRAGKLTLSLLAGAGLLLGLSACEAPIAEVQAAENSAVELSSDMQKASYSIGYSMAANVRREFGDDMDLPAFRAGIADQLGDSESQVTEAEANAALQALVSIERRLDHPRAQEDGERLARVAPGAARSLAARPRHEGGRWRRQTVCPSRGQDRFRL